MQLLDGKRIAAQLRDALRADVASLAVSHGITPGLAVILIGDNPASDVYVRNKVRACAEVGIRSIEHRLTAETSEAELLALIHELNQDSSVHGILVQQPLPAHIAVDRVNAALCPDKDADGFHPVNLGKMMLGMPAPRPCTPAGVMYMLEQAGLELRGKHAVVVGRSNIVGKPMAQLLLAADATVTICHRFTPDVITHVANADIVVVAVGKPNLLAGMHFREGATVVDVGINRLPDGSLTGDVDQSACDHLAWCTPVPGGVGPMTIAMLLHNTVRLAQQATQ